MAVPMLGVARIAAVAAVIHAWPPRGGSKAFCASGQRLNPQIGGGLNRELRISGDGCDGRRMQLR